MTIRAPSYVCGDGNASLIYETIGDRIRRAAATWPDRPAVVARSQNIRMTHGELFAASSQFAAGLLALGLEPGDRVGMWSGNRVEWLVALYGTALAGIIMVPVNPDYQAEDLAYALKKAGIKLLIAASGYKKSDYRQILQAALRESGPQKGTLQLADFPQLEWVAMLGDAPGPSGLLFGDIAAMARTSDHERLGAIAARLSPDDPINIQFTSGTTGRPKGATLSHCNILNNALLVSNGMKLTDRDKICVPVPLYHCFGLVLGALAGTVTGAAIILPGEVYDPLATLQAVAEERCTCIYGVPTMFIAELDHPSFPSFDLTSLRTGAIGGAPCPIEVVRRIINDMHAGEMTIIFGMTETSPVSFMTDPADAIELRVETVGRPLARLEAKIVDEDGRVAPLGAVGEICVRGHAVMLGYWEDPDATAAAIDAGGWMRTGDLGTLDEPGYLRIAGRAKDMIIRGGENVYPREIEEFLHGHPSINSAQIFGIPSDYFGEEVCAWVIPSRDTALSEADVRAFFAGRIAAYKIPKHIRIVDSFPQTVTGKPQKFVMRRLMLEMLADGEPA